MIIRTLNKDIRIKNVISQSIKQNGKTYPSLAINFFDEIKADDLKEILGGVFSILDDEEHLMGEYAGYNTLKNVTLSIAKITTVEQERDALAVANVELTEDLNNEKAKNAEYLENIEALEQENAELLFNNLTGEDYNEVIAE